MPASLASAPSFARPSHAASVLSSMRDECFHSTLPQMEHFVLEPVIAMRTKHNGEWRRRVPLDPENISHALKLPHSGHGC